MLRNTYLPIIQLLFVNDIEEKKKSDALIFATIIIKSVPVVIITIANF